MDEEIQEELDGLRADILKDDTEEVEDDKELESNTDNEETEVETESEEEDESDPEDKEETEDDPESAKETKDNVDDSKPWKSKNKVPAAKRITDLNTKFRNAERQNKHLQDELTKLRNLVVGDDKPKTREDFVDDAEFKNHQDSEAIDARVTAAIAKRDNEANAKREREYLGNKYQENIANAKADLSDLDDVLPNFNTNIPLSIKSRKHLMGSPAGIYTMYKIASDYNLNEQLGNVSARQAEIQVSKIHNEIFNKLKAQSEQTRMPVTKKPKPRAPIRESSSTNTDIMSLEGEDFIEAYNRKFK